MAEQTLDDRNKWTEREAVAWPKRRRQHSFLSARAMITGAERDGYEPGRVADRHPRRKSNLDRLAARAMDTLQAGRQRRRIICNDEVARAEECRRVRCAADAACRHLLSTIKSLADRRSGRSAANHGCSLTRRAAWAWQCGKHRLDDFRGGVLRAPQGRRVGVGNGQRVQRRVHVARIERQKAHAVGLCLLGPDCRQVAERRLARAIGAPPG